MATYQKLDMVIETVGDDDAQTTNVRGTSKAASVTREVRKRDFSFKDYSKNRQISPQAAKFGNSLIIPGVSKEEKSFAVRQQAGLCVELFRSILSNFRSSEPLQFILTLLVDITEDHDTTALLVKKHNGHELTPLLVAILGRHDLFCQSQACLCITRIIAFSPDPMEGDQLTQLISWITSQLKAGNEYLECITKALMSFLRRQVYRVPFFEAHGIKPILDLLDHRINFQLQYELIFSLWMLSFEEYIVSRMKEFPVAIVLSDVLKTSSRPKVQRIILATFRNLIEKSDPETADKYAAEMIHFKAVQVLTILEGRSLDDDDFEDDVKFLQEKLKISLQDLSSFDEYSTEVESRRLEWSPVHKSDKFWRENVMKLNDNNYHLLRCLIGILKESSNPTAMAVASHDLGEYVRYYPRGKNVIDKLGAKELVMGLVNHGNTEVRMQALLSIQKMMVQNWEYLGKQLAATS